MTRAVFLCVGTTAFDGLFLFSVQGHFGSCAQIETKSPFTKLAQTIPPLDILPWTVSSPAEKLTGW